MTKPTVSVDGELRDFLLSDVDKGCPVCGETKAHKHEVVINPGEAEGLPREGRE